MSRYSYIALPLVAFVLATISVMYLTAGTGHAGNILRVVNTTADHDDDGCADLPGGDCTLREAINDVGGSGDLFEFNIPGSDPNCTGGVCTISPTTPLPDVTGSNYVIDGYTQPGASANTNGTNQGLNTNLGIRLDGGDSIGVGLAIEGSNITVRGLIITNFASSGILIDGGGGNQIEGNFIGTDADGDSPQGSRTGIKITDSPNNIIGGTTPAARNLISANTPQIEILFGDSSGNQIVGNLIGTDISGTVNLGGNNSGIVIRDAPNNVIGGTSASARNVVLGSSAILIADTNSTGNIVQGNYVGTDVSGSIFLNELGGRHKPAIEVDGGASENTIGGSAQG